MGDKLLTAAAMVVMIIWSILARDSGVSVAGIGVAIWFPVSILLYRTLLRWLPVIGGIRGRPTAVVPQWTREITAGSLLTASLAIALLASMPPLAALADIIALNFACLAALLDRREGWLPNYILIPMLLTGLVVSMMRGNPNGAILGATAAWVVMSLALAFISISLRANFLSGGDITMAAACGAWVGIENISTFLLITAFLHWLFCIAMRHFRIQATRPVYLHGPDSAWVQPMGPSFALSLALTLLAQNMPHLSGWKYFIPGY
ncbi:A24 family peptidase [Komagataeibacter sp. FNDCR2]|uniref:prepilin peptidase n=1 Tax=Komagataeibacter sp. FNDCR2 TaxID=2878682 RepID=UPI001E394F96|nr:A24 family peptidase [Komagataeibacter sp. FNDCR2]MCE2576826.1 A24 family peptidase [Komagataeibacter sp. FNDCR2]